ncbi:MAG: hypothetical protein ABI844_16195 [Saprospiraceae bacterium]
MILKNWLVILICLLAADAVAQKPVNLEQNPREYVQYLATEASIKQIEVQEQIKVSKNIIKAKKAEQKNTKDESTLASLKEAINHEKVNLLIYQVKLKEKLKISKKYKDMLLLSDEMIVQNLKAETAADTSKVEVKTRANENDKNPEPNEQQNEIKIVDTRDSDKVDTTNMTISEVESVSPEESNKKPKSKGIQLFKSKKEPEENVDLNCNFQVGSTANNTTLEPEILFTYNPEELKKYLKGLVYSKGWAFIGKEPGYTYLQLTLEIASEQALSHYVNLNKSFITLNLINGREIRLINSRFDSGKIDKERKSTIIAGIYILDKSTEKALLTSEIDTMRLNFVSGFEDYTIYNVDFFTRQLACINTIK